MSLLFWCWGRPGRPLLVSMFSGRISLSIICKNQSISINFKIAAVTKWPGCGCASPPVLTRLCPPGGGIDERRTVKDEKTLAPVVFHSALFSLHDVTTHRSHYQHLTRSSIPRSTNIGVTFTQIFLECTTPLNALLQCAWDCWWRPEAEATCKRNLALQWRPKADVSFETLCKCASVCVVLCERERGGGERESIFNTWRETSSISLGLSFTEVEIKHIKPSVLYLLTNKRKKENGRTPRWQTCKTRSINQ